MQVKDKKQIARDQIQTIVNRFVPRQAEYESGDYLESQLRTDFLNELFVALGWDLTNKANLSPLQREVLVEKGDTKGRPDYSFRVRGEDRFFVEAKAVSKGTDKPDDIYQTKMYGWNTRTVNIAVLTDFKTFKVFDTSLKPNQAQPKIGLIFELECSKFATTDFDKLWTFSQEEVFKDSLEKLALKDATSKRLRIPVDAAFLEQMTVWRETLAKDVYRNNSSIGIQTLNDVVQRLLDRFVFIRILEDRKIIESKTLREIADNWKEAKHRDIQTPLNALFKRLNNDFNGNIFKPHPCETTIYDSKVLAEIIDELYPPKSPYDFKVIGVDLLGVIYEKYLGKTIRLTEKRVKVEEKPEVRKAGGVYYTPKWVVDYIISNTVGVLIRDKKPEDVAKLRFLDPACGSGSFLIGALDYLFKHHLDYYAKNLKEAKHSTLFPHLVIEHDEDGNVTHRLSIETKSQILKNNIYGVDIDPQACEITMMSLYIKVLEGEKTLPHHKELLPSLSNNIRCGNSLIEFDFLSQQTVVADAEKEKANPFEWRSKTTGFGNVIGEKDGFDAIIGNPPYIRIQTMKEWAPQEVEYYPKKFMTAASGNYDIYVLFVERAVQLLGDRGLFGFIMPHKFFQAEYGRNLRQFIAEKKLLREIVNFTDQQVFEEASTYTCLLFLTKSPMKNIKYSEIYELDVPTQQVRFILDNSEYNNGNMSIGRIDPTTITEEAWNFQIGPTSKIIEKMNLKKIKLDEITKHFFAGLQTSADDFFIVKFEKDITNNFIEVFCEYTSAKHIVEKNALKPYLKGKEIQKYQIAPSSKLIFFPYVKNSSGEYELIDETTFKNDWPKTYEFFLTHKKFLSSRENNKMDGKNWYGLTYPRSINLYEKEKIMSPFNAFHSSYYLDKEAKWFFAVGVSGGYGIIIKDEINIKAEYLLAVLNSSLIELWIHRNSTALRGGYYSYEYRFTKRMPIVLPNLNNSKEKDIHDQLVKYVEQVLELNKKKQSSDSSKIELIDREVKVYEEKIDYLVYRLYNLTEDEIKIVEQSQK